MRIAAIAAVVVVLVCGCTRVVDDATPVVQPQKLDCDLIFPAPSPNA